MADPRVLVLHNRYRQTGGEEQALALHLRALAGAGIEHRLLERQSAGVTRLHAGVAMLGGGEATDVREAVAGLGATIAHCHNLQPLLGPRALAAARDAGARVVLHLHNFRVFCAIGVAFRDGEPCFRCHHGKTLAGLALNCRGNLAEAGIYAAALARQLAELRGVVDRFVAPSGWAAGQLARLGIPSERLSVLPHYLPAERLAASTRAGRGEYAVAVGRLSPEKGFEVAIDAAAASNVPLRIAGAGPLEEALRRRIVACGAPAELVGLVTPEERDRLFAGAAMAVVPSAGNETFGYVALEAMGAGLPVLATRAGALPEIVGDQATVGRSDADALAVRMRELFEDPAARVRAGEAAIERARGFDEEGFRARLGAIYAEL